MPRARLPRLVVLSTALAVWSGPRAGWGQGEPVALHYQAAEGCPGEAEFVGQVLARTQLARFTGPAPGVRTFAVTLEGAASSYRGRLEIAEPGAAPTVRELSGDSCGEVSSAIALLTALAVDPASLAAPPASAASSAIPVLPPLAPTAVEAPPAPLRGSFGADFSTTGNLTPGALLGASAFVGLEQDPRRGAPWSGAGRLGFAARSSSLTAASDSQGTFWWLVGFAEGCPLAWEAAQRLILRPCALLELGALRGRGAAGAVARPVTNGAFWASAGVDVRAEWRSSERFSWEAALGVGVPLRTYAFQFQQPAVLVYQVPPVNLALTLGASFAFL